MLAISLNPIDWATSAAGALTGAVGGAIFDQATEWVEGGLAYLAGEAAGFLTNLGEANVGDETLTQLGGIFKWVALVTVVITMILGATRAMVGSQNSMGDVLREVPITLMMLSGWYFVVSLWLESTAALTRLLLGDALLSAFENGLLLDPGVSSFFRLIVALLMLIFLLIFLVEVLVLSHMLTIAAIIGPLSIALRPWPGLRDVSAKMVRNLAALSLTPVLTVASLSIALRTLNEEGQLSLGAALGAIAGLAVTILMPAMIGRFLPLDGSGGLGARGMVAAALGTVAVVGGAIAAGGAAGASAGGTGGGAPGALSASTLSGGGAGSSGGGASGAMTTAQGASTVMTSVDDA